MTAVLPCRPGVKQRFKLCTSCNEFQIEDNKEGKWDKGKWDKEEDPHAHHSSHHCVCALQETDRAAR
ncbi:hypothetical protein V1264_002457 [Littorina saxatilis]|uniref:Uncharacterized protein n=1 Tax=Littorina saxatilis TaxID=31220 RepID=A0AAN9C1Q5_9CAEN